MTEIKTPVRAKDVDCAHMSRITGARTVRCQSPTAPLTLTSSSADRYSPNICVFLPAVSFGTNKQK